MAYSRTGFTVKTNGQTLVVTATLNSSTSTLYSDPEVTSSVTLPQTITSDTTYYVADAGFGSQIVSVKQLDGTELWGRGVDCYKWTGIQSIEPVPSPFQLASDSARYAAATFGANAQSGHYYYLMSQGGKNATAWVDGALRLSAVEITRPVTVDTLSVDCTTRAASSNVKIVVYSSDRYGGSPSTNLYASAAISTVASGIKEATGVALSLTPGIYWFGAVAYGGTPTISTSQVTGHPLVPYDLGTSAPTTGDAGAISHQTTGLTTGTIPATWAGAIATAAPPRLIVKVG